MGGCTETAGWFCCALASLLWLMCVCVRACFCTDCHTHGVSVANYHPDAHPNSHSDPHTHRNRVADGHADAYGVAVPDADVVCVSVPDADTDPVAVFHGHPDAVPDADADADADWH